MNDLATSPASADDRRTIRNRTFDEIALGDEATLERTLTAVDIQLFAALSGDVNPQHMDPAFAASTRFHGVIAHGMWGAFPSYLAERFPSDVRGAGAGFCYHAGALAGSFTPSVIGYMQDRGMTLPSAMTLAIAASGAAVALLIWLGPETRGRSLAS